jgi:hypothetical protein
MCLVSERSIRTLSGSSSWSLEKERRERECVCVTEKARAIERERPSASAIEISCVLVMSTVLRRQQRHARTQIATRGFAVLKSVRAIFRISLPK